MLNCLVKDAGLSVLYAVHMETMGDRIKQLRIARGLTQPALGELCGGVTKSAVSQWEDGSTENIKLKTFIRLCEVLQTDPQYLIWGADRSPTGAPGAASRLRRPSTAR